MKYRVTTRAELRRTYEVEAENEKAAIAATTFVTPDDEEEIEEETLTVSAQGERNDA
jgi:hypothetical protein